MVLEWHKQIVAHCKVLIHAEVLEFDTDAEVGALKYMQLRDITVAEANGATIWANAPQDELEQRALAGAIRPDDAAKLAFTKPQVQSVNRMHAAKGLVQTGYLENWCT